MPAANVSEKPVESPVAANAEPAATTVAPMAMASVPANRSRSSGRPRIRHADHSVPPTSTTYAGMQYTRNAPVVHPFRTPRNTMADAPANMARASAHSAWYGRRRRRNCRTSKMVNAAATSAASSGNTHMAGPFYGLQGLHPAALPTDRGPRTKKGPAIHPGPRGTRPDNGTTDQLAVGSLRCRGPVPRARGADPRHRVLGGVRLSGHVVVREPPDRVDPELLAGGMDRRRDALVPATAPGGPGAGHGRRGALPRDGRASVVRVPHAGPRRSGGVVPRPGVAAPRHRRPPCLHARRDVRHHRPEGGRGAAGLPGLSRPVDRIAEQGAVRGAPEPRGHQGEPSFPVRGGAVYRSRRLQAGERHAGPRRG